MLVQLLPALAQKTKNGRLPRLLKAADRVQVWNQHCYPHPARQPAFRRRRTRQPKAFASGRSGWPDGRDRCYHRRCYAAGRASTPFQEAFLVKTPVVFSTILRQPGSWERNLGPPCLETKLPRRRLRRVLRKHCCQLNVPDFPYIVHYSNIIHITFTVNMLLSAQVLSLIVLERLCAKASLHPGFV